MKGHILYWRILKCLEIPFIFFSCAVQSLLLPIHHQRKKSSFSRRLANSAENYLAPITNLIYNKAEIYEDFSVNYFEVDSVTILGWMVLDVRTVLTNPVQNFAIFNSFYFCLI